MKKDKGKKDRGKDKGKPHWLYVAVPEALLAVLGIFFLSYKY